MSPTESNPRVSAWVSSGLGTATAIAAAWGMIALDDRKETLDKLFEQVEYAGSSDNPYALEQHIPVSFVAAQSSERSHRFGRT